MAKKYVLITPARNEEKYIENTIISVINQTLKPIKWIIVNDGSIDNTEKIAKKYQMKYEFIEVISTDNLSTRNFSCKVKAFLKGYNYLRNLSYDYIGNLDADISFEKDYYENIINKFENNQKIGIAGGIITEVIGGKYVEQDISLNSVAGAVQIFRKKCFEDIGGYTPVSIGGIDSIAEIMARKAGWIVKTYPEYKINHYRQVSSGNGRILMAKFRQGKLYFMIGYHPLFHFIASIIRMKNRPFLFGGAMRIAGYLWAYIKNEPKQLSEDIISFLRKEQRERLKDKFKVSSVINRNKKN